MMVSWDLEGLNDGFVGFSGIQWGVVVIRMGSNGNANITKNARWERLRLANWKITT